VLDKYGGGQYVAQIITFGKLKTRAVIRDVGRALDIPLREVDTIAKMVPDVLNISLDDALKLEPRLAELADQKTEVADLINICRVLEGLPRHASIHAAGVVIADKEGKRETLEADRVVLALGAEPERRVANALQGKVPELYVIGDSTKPARIMEATYDGSRIGRLI